MRNRHSSSSTGSTAPHALCQAASTEPWTSGWSARTDAMTSSVGRSNNVATRWDGSSSDRAPPKNLRKSCARPNLDPLVGHEMVGREGVMADGPGAGGV